jgi:hypothetical protein
MGAGASCNDDDSSVDSDDHERLFRDIKEREHERLFREVAKTNASLDTVRGHGHDIESFARFVNKSSGNQTALMVAAAYGHSEIAECLIFEGADLEATCDKGYTALEYATTRQKLAVAALLRKAGARGAGT